MNPEKRRARAKHQVRLHNLEVAYKRRRKAKGFVLKVIEDTIAKDALDSELKMEIETETEVAKEV